MADLRSIVREILLEELGNHRDRDARVRREKVTIRGDEDLNAFARRVLELSADPGAAARIRDGRLRFELAGSPPAGREAPGGRPAPGIVSFDKGLVTEKHVAALEQASSLRIGKGVRFTPLAKDEIRRKGIKVERKTS